VQTGTLAAAACATGPLRTSSFDMPVLFQPSVSRMIDAFAWPFRRSSAEVMPAPMLVPPEVSSAWTPGISPATCGVSGASTVESSLNVTTPTRSPAPA
jgi:hypothetical protein